MDNSQVAHLWANKSRTSAKGSSFYFEGDTIYSYGSHFPIARHYKGVILFTSRRRSVTTERHKSITRQACNHIPIFTVANVLDDPCGADVKGYGERIKYQAAMIARKRDLGFWLEYHKALVDEANTFCARFGFKTRFAMPDEATLAELKERSKVAAAKKAKATQARNARIESENAVAIQEWLAGQRDSLPYSIQAVYLRANDSIKISDKADGSNPIMQTSKGATVPLSEAQKAFRFAQLKRASGWHRNGDTFKVGDFQLDAVNKFGVVAGCHRVAWDEIERFAALQGWM